MSVLVTLEKWSADYDALFLRRNLAGARPRLTRRTAPRVSLRLRRPPATLIADASLAARIDHAAGCQWGRR
jgi:hypothetical protein